MAVNNFGKIGVLLGGPSAEREISLKSGRAVYKALSDAGYDVVLIDIVDDDIKSNAILLKESAIDVAFIALHGHFGEDGPMQSILEELDIPYTGSGPMASKLAMDKIASRKIFKSRGLSVPKCLEVDDKAYRMDDALSLPVVVKPATNGSSIGLSIVENKNDFAKALETALSLDSRAIVEEYIKGREFTVGILNEKALPVIEVKPHNKFFDFEAKYKSGMTDYIVPAQIDERLSERAKEVGLAAHRALGCRGFSRVDMILGSDDNFYVLELNSIPGLTETSLLPKAARCVGIDFLKLCLILIEGAYEKNKDRAVN
ncbi:MAG: D-alanine--D-alanine ligase [Candidatus Omnitrophica bacterium]|nr:D-alanine--D-alanine ligase [Candidatus Omnitrophota bacterium]MDD5610032.1 D-alanine--D-alanine ligase [Candidatus Omnitrophota bacterium]